MKVVKFITKFNGYLVYKVFPMPSASSRDSRTWLFASHVGWNHSSNAKSLFLQLQEAISHKDSDITAIWIAQDRREACKVRTAGFRSYARYSLKGLYHCLTAGVYIYTEHTSDINRLTSRTAFCVDLWHGVGIKKLYALDPNYFHKYYGFKKEPSEHSFLDRMKVPLHIYRKPDIILCPSHFQCKTLFAPMFQIPEEQMILTGYPRNGMLLWPNAAIRAYAERYASQDDLTFLDELATRHFDKVYIYMPTWRIGCKEPVFSMAGIDFRVLEDALAKNNSLFILKPHNFDEWQFENTSHIVRLPDVCEIYTVLPYTDCLITDYSSIYSDYLLMNKEIILFPFDRKVYASDSNETLDYDTYYPGKKVYTFEALVNLIRENEDCHLSPEEHKWTMRIYQECHGNGVDLIQEIRRRHEGFLNARCKGKIWR